MKIGEEQMLWPDVTSSAAFDDPALRQQLLTYIGNKRALLEFVNEGVDRVKERSGKDKLRVLDAFSGSGVVSRFFKAHCSSLLSNDFEAYSSTVNACYLANRSTVPIDRLTNLLVELEEAVQSCPVVNGPIRRHYAPKDENRILSDERVFYTIENAIRIDSYRIHIDRIIPDELRVFFLAPLLVAASVHTNTSGVFKGFYKNRAGIGQYGGERADALSRIRAPIKCKTPVFTRCECDVKVTQEDANALARTPGSFDLAYLDPPYNQHPYGSNYFMLNLILEHQEPRDISRVSGIPVDWRRSKYNKPRQCLAALTDLVSHLNAPYILLSYNDEGFISRAEFELMLQRVGRVQVLDRSYNAFRGSRNLGGAPNVC